MYTKLFQRILHAIMPLMTVTFDVNRKMQSKQNPNNVQLDMALIKAVAALCIIPTSGRSFSLLFVRLRAFSAVLSASDHTSFGKDSKPQPSISSKPCMGKGMEQQWQALLTCLTCSTAGQLIYIRSNQQVILPTWNPCSGTR
jgi:hypothetical protein